MCLERSERNDKNYELIEYLNDVNREHAEVLVEQNINGKTDTSYIYGAEINGGFDRISLDRFDGSTGYYLYDARGSVSGITNEEGQVYQSYRYSVTGEITFGAPQYENEYTYNGESYNPNIQSQYLRARYYCVVTATFLTEDSYLGSLTEPLTLNRYNYCVSSYLNYTDPSGNEVEVLESLKGWIIDPDTQAQKTIENYENQRLSLEDAIESGLLNNRADQIFLDYGDVVMGPAVKTPADIIVIRETVKGNSDSKEMQRTATAGFYAGFVGQGIEYTQIISNADYQLSMIITSAKGVNSINNPLSYLLFIKDFSLTQTIDAAKAGLQDVWNGTYDSAIGRKIGAGTFNYLLMTIGGAQLKGKGTACKAVESGSKTDVTTGLGYDAGDTPVRIDGDWTENDMKQALLGHPPRGLGSPDIHHGGQMPGGALHEVLPGQHRNNPALHPNTYNQGVTPEMRMEDRQLHWWYRAREQGADELLPDWIYD